MVTIEVGPTCHWIDLMRTFLDKFGWLADSFILDFHVENHFARLPHTWQMYLPCLTPDDLGNILDLGIANPWRTKEVPPLSLLALRSTVKVLALKRDWNDKYSRLPNMKTASPRNADNANLFREFENLFSKHVKPKKRHEIVQFSNTVSILSDQVSTKEVIDVGSGLGHLSRYLTYGCSLNLTCIDYVERFGDKAGKFDAELELNLKKKNITGFHPPSHLSLKLELNKFQKELQRETKFGIVGLHTCGNLAPVIIHNYLNSTASFIVSVGCCYMKLDSEGYPLSQYLKSCPTSALSYEAREVSCHAIEQYAKRLREGQASKLIVHSHRAVLETVLVEKFNLRRAGLRGVRGCEKMSFAEYAMQATKALEGVDLAESDVVGDKIQNMTDDWYKVVVFFSIRLLIATIVESLVVLDRALFIKEKDKSASVEIVPLFDPYLSPRNLAIISHKSDRS